MKFVIFNDIQLIVSFRNDLILVTMNMKTVRGIRLLIYGSKLFSSTDCCFFFYTNVNTLCYFIIDLRK